MPEPLISSCSVVVPVYNSQDTLVALASRLEKVLPQIAGRYELILVNDGSRDASWEVICSLTKQYPWVRGIDHMRNYGQHNALLCGIRAAQCEVIVTMDDDLQHPPEEMHKLVAKLLEGYDVVYGFPRKLPHSFMRNLFSRLTKKVLAFVMDIKTVQEISAYRAFWTDIRRSFSTYESPGVIIDVLLSWGTTRFVSILVNHEPRQYGESNYNFSKLASIVFLILTGFSTVPLRAASLLGFAFTILGILVLIYVIAIYFTAGSIPGFPFLASIVAVFSGTQLFALGIIGEYIARIFDRSSDRPPYVIGRTIGGGQPQDSE